MNLGARVIAAAVLAAWSGSVWAETPPSAEDIAFFERDIRPILVRRCYECHSGQAKTLQGGLRLDSLIGLMQGGDSGPAVVPGKPEESLLAAAVRWDDAIQMPPAGKLPDREAALLTEWIRRGAPFPAGSATPAASQQQIDWEEARRFWSFQPLRRSPPPEVRDPEWIRRKIDAFILAKLDEQKLSPSPPAERRVLLRRAAFDLTGLPPTPEEAEAFLADDSPDAYERLIDRLLASPRYGERWGRYWLDLARYTDQTASWLQSTAHAWLYRDWVVQALNDDRPYDEFVRLQLAADLIEGADPADLAALGFVGLSPTYWKELKLAPDVIKTVVAEEWEERIDAVSRTFLGLTVACARCHDHKFDPVTTEDYYALAGVFASTRLVDRFLLPEEDAARVRAAHEEVKSLETQLAPLEKTKDDPEAAQQAAELRRHIAEIKSTTPNYDAPQACAVDEASIRVLPDGANATKVEYVPGEPLDLHVQVRGEPSKLGPLTPRRFLQVLSEGEPQPFQHGSGRRELAEAIVTDAAPLAARVMVNRVWRHHFGRGLVDTPSDFGVQGARPTHPELLDDLAARFIEHGWSLKWLHREIMLSATFQQTSQNAKFESSVPHSALRIPHSNDPENRLLWRMNRRRLEFEPWRDAMLAAAGSLDGRLGGPSLDLNDAGNRRRTLYGRIHRHELEVMLRLHDFPDPATHSPSREATTTPLQGLFVLNSSFVARQGEALAERLARGHPDDVEARIRRAYSLLFTRPPTEGEIRLATEFLGEGNEPKTWRLYLQTLLGSNEFLFVD